MNAMEDRWRSAYLGNPLRYNLRHPNNGPVSRHSVLSMGRFFLSRLTNKNVYSVQGSGRVGLASRVGLRWATAAYKPPLRASVGGRKCV